MELCPSCFEHVCECEANAIETAAQERRIRTRKGWYEGEPVVVRRGSGFYGGEVRFGPRGGVYADYTLKSGARRTRALGWKR